MPGWARAGRSIILVTAAAGLAACEQPDWLTRRDPLPPLPAWVDPLVGRPLAEAFQMAPDTACIGNTEQVEALYGGARPGARLSGWGWDVQGKAPPSRIIIAGRDQRIAGGGESGRPRPDVAEARPEVDAEGTGWQAFTTLSEGEAVAYGVLADGARICKLGAIKL